MDDQSVYCTVNLMWKLVKWQTTSFHHTNHHLFSTPCDLDRLLFSLIAHSDSGSNAASFFVCVLKQWDIHLSLVLDCYRRNSLHSYPFTWVIEIFLLRKCLFLLRGGKHAAHPMIERPGAVWKIDSNFPLVSVTQSSACNACLYYKWGLPEDCYGWFFRCHWIGRLESHDTDKIGAPSLILSRKISRLPRGGRVILNKNLCFVWDTRIVVGFKF